MRKRSIRFFRANHIKGILSLGGPGVAGRKTDSAAAVLFTANPPGMLANMLIQK
jgi:hypothetical protein